MKNLVTVVSEADGRGPGVQTYKIVVEKLSYSCKQIIKTNNSCYHLITVLETLKTVNKNLVTVVKKLVTSVPEATKRTWFTSLATVVET